jgi:L-lactate utilization protein LutB
LETGIEETLKNLTANGFKVCFVENREAAKKLVLDSISQSTVVGVGDSATLRQIGILDELEKRRVRVLNPSSRELASKSAGTEIRDNVARQVFSSDVLITGINVVTMNGKLLNIDAVGNRVASTIFGPRKVFIVVGKNKIVKNVDEGLHRLRNVIAPFHAKTKGYKTPCTVAGRCSDCGAPKRICCVTSIIEKRPWRTEIVVVMVDEDLGLGWDETWPEERIQKIKSNYERVTWASASENGS